MKRSVKFVTILCSLTMCACENPIAKIIGKKNEKYEVTWKNYNGDILEIDRDVEPGTIPSFDRETPPERPMDDAATYEWSNGWDKPVEPVTSNVVFTAVFNATPRKYEITFQYPNGSVIESNLWDYDSTPSCSIIPKMDSTLSTDYSFAGWDRNIVPVAGKAIYKAVFNETKYDIVKFKYVFNDTKHEIENKNQVELRAGDTLNLLDPHCDGYSFDGWFLDSEYTKKVTKLPNVDEGRTLYGKFSIKENHISYDLNGGEVDPDLLVETLKCTDDKVELPHPTKVGYEFVGWADSNGKSYEALEDVCNDLSLSALYKANEYIITLLYSDKTAEYKTVKYDETVKLPHLTKDGYSFLGWADIEETDPTKLFTETPYKLLRNVTLEERWSAPIEYKIEYKNLCVNGEELPEGYPTSYNIESPLPELPVPTRKGYEFVKWTENDERGKEIPYLHGAFGIFSNKEGTKTLTLYANWKAKDVEISFDFNGGTLQRKVEFVDGRREAVAVSTFEYAEFRKLDDKTDAQFKGWVDDKDNYGTFDTDKIIDKDLTLTSVWEPLKSGAINAKINEEQTFEAKGFNVTYYQITSLVKQTVSFESSGSYDLKGELLLKSNNSSLKFDDDSASDGKNFKFTYELKANTSYLLKVSSLDENAKGNCQITMLSDAKQIPEGKVYSNLYVINSTTEKFDSNFVGVGTPVKEGYEFGGWEDVNDPGTFYYAGKTIQQEVVNLKAVWKEPAPSNLE